MFDVRKSSRINSANSPHNHGRGEGVHLRRVLLDSWGHRRRVWDTRGVPLRLRACVDNRPDSDYDFRVKIPKGLGLSIWAESEDARILRLPFGSKKGKLRLSI